MSRCSLGLIVLPARKGSGLILGSGDTTMVDGSTSGATTPAATDSLEFDADFEAALPDLYRLRAMLTGESVVDSHAFWLPNRQAVDEHIRLCGYDTDNPLDMDRLLDLHQEAVHYLRDIHGYPVPASLEDPETIHDVFLYAALGDGSEQRIACMALKVLHIINHIAGRELTYKTPVSEAQLIDRVNTKVFAVVDQLRAADIAVNEFAAGQKTRTSLVTKLLAKPDTLATHVFDRLRYRLVVGERNHICEVLLALSRTLVPFNYVVPEQSQNGIVTAEDMAAVLNVPVSYLLSKWGSSVEAMARTPQNEFSGRSYRCVNFVADIPVRIDDLAPESYPAVAFVQAEIQIVDTATELANNEGDNAHPKYKARQRQRVRNRLEGASDPASLIARLVPKN